MERADILRIKSRWEYAKNLAKTTLKDLEELKKFLEWFSQQEELTDMKELPCIEKERLIKILNSFIEIYRLVG